MPSNSYTRLPTSGTSVGSPSSSQEQSVQEDQRTPAYNESDTGVGTSSGPGTAELPDLPPAYEPSPFEEFEIDNSNTADDGTNMDSSRNFRSKAEMFAQSFNRCIVQPINNALDPIYQLYCYSNAKFEYYVSKMGNPLIVKRILYIIVIAGILYFASLSGLNADGVVGSHSDFTNPSKLQEFIDLSVDPKRLEENLEYLSSMPHMSGTAGDLALSKYFAQLIKQSRLDINPDIIYEAYTNYPFDPKVQLLNGDEILLDCDLKENIDDGVETNDFYKLAFNPGSRDMTSRGKIVYVNYGTLADYNLLKKKSVEVKGSILLMKYGGIYPAHKKLRYAQEQGAVGVLFISDPELDQYYNMESIQREPVSFVDLYPGNILSYGNAAANSVDDGDMNEKLQLSQVAPSIPSLPIKWKDFITIMSKLSNQGARIEEWDIKINDVTVPIWSGKDHEILLQNSLTQRPRKESWNIFGKLQGSEQDTFAVIIGASRDTLCYGAIENSGSAILLELMNIFSEMSSSLVWRPLRTIYFASFTGSKYNLAGVTNFAVKNSDFFRRDVYAYIDLDDIIQGNDLEISSDPLFESLVKQAVHNLMKSNATDSHVNVVNLKDVDYSINPISNSVPLIQHHNVAAISVKLTQSTNNSSGDKLGKNFNVAHYPKNSCFDNFKNFKENLIDPDMSKHVFMTKLISSIVVKLVDTPILPYNVREMFDTLSENIEEVKRYVSDQTTDGGSLLNFNELDELMSKMIFIAEQHEAFVSTWADICDDGFGSEPNLLSVNRWDWNSKLLIMTKVMIELEGTFNNPFNYNVFYGREQEPENRNLATSDGDADYKQSLPGVWDAIDQGRWDIAQKQLNDLNEMLDRCMNLFQY